MERFWSKVDKSGGPDGCWPWQVSTSRGGYGQFRLRGRTVRAPRIAWMLHHKREVPSGLHIRHICDNPPCCNPTHLKLGTHADNMRDMADRGRAHGSPPVGVANFNAKLTEEIVREIRRLASEKILTYEEIAFLANISRTAVGHVVRKQTWQHVV